MNEFPRIPYDEAMLKYGSDKPDLRNPLLITDVTSVFSRKDVEFKAFRNVIDAGGVVRAIRAPKVSDKPRSFFDKLNSWAQEQGAPGLGYITFEAGAGKGPIARFVNDEAQKELRQLTGCEDGDAVFFVCDQKGKAAKMAGAARTKIAQDMDCVEKNAFRFCWIVDFPMYEYDDFYGWIKFDEMLRLLDRYPLLVETKGGTTHFTSRFMYRDWETSILALGTNEATIMMPFSDVSTTLLTFTLQKKT